VDRRVRAAVGLTFIAASLLSLIRLRQVRWRTARDALFLLGLAVTFVFQLIAGADVVTHPGNSGDVNTIAVLVVICFLIGTPFLGAGRRPVDRYQARGHRAGPASSR